MMQRILFSWLRTYVWCALHVFYRQIRVSGVSHVPQGAVIFAGNHQNALLDALLIVCSSRRYTHFVARADIFSNRWVKKLLHAINMMPIYRIRDGWQSLTQNEGTFKACTRILQAQEPIVIFPEGNHGSARRLRRLSKGFTRLAFEALRQTPDLPVYIVPVGLNYTRPREARSAVHIIYGPALLANPYYQLGEPRGAHALREALGEAMQKLITHLPESRAELAATLNDRPVNFLEPETVNAWIANPQLPLPLLKSRPDFVGVCWRVLLFPAVLAWKKWNGRIKDRVFVASFKFAVALVAGTLLLAGAMIAAVVYAWS